MFDPGGMRQDVGTRRDFRLGGSLYGGLMRWFPDRLSRDITLVHDGLQEAGRAFWLGSQHPEFQLSPVSDLQRAVSAVRTLLGKSVPVTGLNKPGAAID
jgi:hypothetical protein